MDATLSLIKENLEYKLKKFTDCPVIANANDKNDINIVDKYRKYMPYTVDSCRFLFHENYECTEEGEPIQPCEFFSMKSIRHRQDYNIRNLCQRNKTRNRHTMYHSQSILADERI